MEVKKLIKLFLRDFPKARKGVLGKGRLNSLIWGGEKIIYFGGKNFGFLIGEGRWLFSLHFTDFELFSI